MLSIEVNGTIRHLGWKPTPDETIGRMHCEGILELFASHPRLRAAPEDTWVESTCQHFWRYRKDQNGQGACVGFSGSHALTIALAKAGFDVPNGISPAALYAGVNGGRDDGANIGDALEFLTKYGAFPSGYTAIGDLDWKTVYKTKYWTNPTSAIAKEAAKYKIVESVLCANVDEFLAGLQSGEWSGQFGLGVGNKFDTDEYGSLGKCDGAQINHALCATGGMRKHPKTGVWEVEGANSWKDWGIDGKQLFYCDKSWLDRKFNEFWLIRAATIPE